MAIYHLSVKTVSRSAGRSSTAAAAYRAGVQITDERTGEIHDYARRGGVVSATVVLPLDAPEWAADRRTLWNAAEQAETRRNSTVAREFEVALPAELSPAERQRLACDYAAELVARHGCAADVAIHAPGKEGDNRNHHAHILLTTRRLGADGFGCKTRELDDPKTGKALVAEWRERWATLTNARLIEAGVDARIDHRSHAERGIDRAPGQHQGPAVSAILRRGDQSHVADRQAEQVAAHQAQIDAAKAEAAQIAADLAEAIEAQAEADKALAGLQERAEIARLLAGGAVGMAALDKIAPSAFAGLSVAELAAEIEQTRRRLQPTDELARRDPDVSRLAQHRHGLAEQHRQALAEAERHRQEAEAFRAAHRWQAWLHGRGWGHSVDLLAIEQAQEAAQAKAAQIAPALEQAEQAHDAAYTAAAWRIRAEQRPDDERLTALNEARDAALRREGEAERAELARQEQARRQAEADRQAQARPAPSRRPTHRPAAERDDDGPGLSM